MCISAAMLTAIASTTAAVGTIYGVEQQSKQASRARNAQQNIDAMAAQTANARLAQRRRALSANSLITDQSTSGVANAGRTTLGGG